VTVVYADDKLVRGSEILELYQEAGWTTPAGRPAGAIEESVRQATVFLTARDGAKLVGYVSALSDRVYYTHVTEIMVRQSHRRRGVGSALVRRLLEAIPGAGTVSIFAEPDAEGFYRRFGFVQLGGGMLLRRP
jgi:GNAT superfamily N-acetyltransferase